MRGLNKAGGAFTAYNTARTEAYEERQMQLAAERQQQQLQQQQREASAEMAREVNRAQALGQSMATIGSRPVSAPQEASYGERVLQAGVGIVETLYAGAHNSVVRILGGAASVPYAIAGGAEAGVQVQEAVKESFGYGIGVRIQLIGSSSLAGAPASARNCKATSTPAAAAWRRPRRPSACASSR